MLFEGHFSVKAPRQDVWDFLFNIEKMAKCVPGVGEVKVESESSYSAQVKAKVGFLSATFQLRIRILDVTPPSRLVSLFEGKDGKIGSSLKAMNTVELLVISSSQTEVRYRSDVTFMGKLGTLGLSVIKGKAMEMMKTFSEAVKKEFEKADTGEERGGGFR